ncbi:MAG: general secretion pathway protein GspB [Candidatus Competibacteraceae bacterium]|nr:general secretion pathway protein GspB [Candidatus Competibacteraceae bacterium]
MSYILEALRKAEQERNLGRVPDLQTAPMPTPQTRQRLWPFILGLALVINGLVLAVLLWPDHWSRAPADPAPPPLQDATTNGPARQPAGVQTEISTPSSVPAQTIQSTPEPISTPEVNLTSIVPPSTLPPALSFSEQNLALPATQSAIALQALPMAFRQTVPKLNLDIHVYSEADRKRFVLINSKRYQEGDRLNEGPLLEFITADGAVLSYRGQRFLLPVYQ